VADESRFQNQGERGPLGGGEAERKEGDGTRGKKKVGVGEGAVGGGLEGMVG